MSTGISPSAGSDDPLPARCGSCGARVRDGQTWCALCHSRLEPEVPVARVGPGGPSTDGMADPAAEAVAERLLTELRLAEGGADLPRGFTAVRGRGAAVALSVGVGLTLALVLVGVPALIGWLF